MKRLQSDATSRPSRRDFIKKSAQVSLAASLFANWGCSPSQSPSPATRPPNVLLLSLDTTRADHLSCYGYPRKTSPTIDLLAESGVLYRNAISTSSWTLPAHASMFTGKFVTSHGARKYAEGDRTLDEAFGGGEFWSHYRVRTISQNEVLLPEILQKAGYSTGAVVAGPWLKKAFGLHRGFDYHDDDNILGLERQHKRLGTEVTSRALDWLTTIGDRPFFLFLNYFDPHVPFSLPENFIRRFDNTPNPGLHAEDQLMYDHEILFMDFSIRVLFDTMKQRGLLDNTLIVAIADHGHAYGEHGKFTHGETVYQEEVHVPFIVRYPMGEVAPAVRDEYVQPIDLMPLILNRLELPVPEGVQGSPIEMITHPILAEVYPSEGESTLGHWQCLVEDGKKFLFNSKGNHELYDLAADPREQRNIIADNPDLAKGMMANLMTHFESLPRPEGAPEPLNVDQSTIEELEAMGYL